MRISAPTSSVVTRDPESPMSQSPPSMPAPKPFPVPENFPVEWPTPEVANFTFNQDRMHAPFPMTPMSAWFSQRFATGFTQGLAANSIPMRVDVLRLNTYFYLGVNPSVPPEQMPEAEAKAGPAVQAAAGRAWSRWESEWLPELKRGWDTWGARGLSEASDTELVAAARDLEEWYTRIWTIHFDLLPPVMVAASMFQDLYGQIFPERSGVAAFRLLQGSDSMSLEAGRELWLVAQQARNNAELMRTIDEVPAAELWDRLGTFEAGRALRRQLENYLAMYGRRSDNIQELASVSWTEDPSPALANLKRYVNDASDPGELMAKQRAERDSAVAEARSVLATMPGEIRGAFEALLPVAQAFGRVQEDHNFWIDQRGTHEARQFCLEVGRRLAARGVLSEASDVFLLDMNEALDGLRGISDGLAAGVAQRRAEMDQWAKIQPPPQVGMDYGPPPPNPVATAISRFFGTPPTVASTKTEIVGNTGAPGKVTGVARIIMNIAEAELLEPNEILVAPTTAPPWTPFFATAAAVVTETGGVLSHCAIVAREYGIPAVVGAVGATSIIPNGARIEVDGDAGIVRVLS